MNRDLTKGKIAPSLLIFSLPMIFGNLLQQLYNIADTLIVGKFIGPAALSAVGSSYALMVLITSVILGLSMGAGVVFSHFYGAGNREEMKTAVFNGFTFILAVSLIINIIAFLLLDKIILWLNIPPEAAGFTREYLGIIFAGILFIFVYNFFACVLRSAGDTVTSLVSVAVSAILNIILDIVFIVNFAMGVKGAALATVISQGISALMMTAFFFAKGRELLPKRKNIRLSRRIISLILSNSLLTALQQSIMNFGILMVQGLVNSFGFTVSAAFAAGVKIDAFAYMPAQDFGNAFATFAAQNYGAGDKERINKGFKTALLMSSLFCAVSSGLVFIFAEPLMKLFVNANETAIISVGAGYLRTEGAFYVGIGVLFLLYALYRGLGKPSMSIVLTVVSLGSRVALAYALSAVPALGVTGIWISVPIGWFLADVLGIAVYLRRKRLASL